MTATRIFIPPLAKPTGGTAVLLALARHLDRAGFPVALALRNGQCPHQAPDLETVPFEAPGLAPGDIWLTPEGWPNALAPGLRAKADCLVYCQNWAYLFGGLPPEVRLGDLPIRFLAVSEPVARYVEAAVGSLPPILRPGVDLALFAPLPGRPAAPPVRVAYMPRKNKALAEQIKRLCAERRDRTGLRLDFAPIDGLTPEGVAERLASCHVFLATGFPEGCPLPPLEALASGCLVAGFAGFGGHDYLRQALPGGYVPEYAPRPVAWGENAFLAADGDALGATLALERAARLTLDGGAGLDAMLANARLTAQAYGLDRQAEAARTLWRTWLDLPASKRSEPAG